MLHIVTEGPAQSNFTFILTDEEDKVILFGDGVYWLLTDSVRRPVHALTDHCTARGLEGLDSHPQLTRISYPEFVALTEQHTPIATW